MDKFTIRSLELIDTMQEDGTSLLDVVDRTITPMGGRMLRRWLVFPLKDVKPINERLDVVEYFTASQSSRTWWRSNYTVLATWSASSPR